MLAAMKDYPEAQEILQALGRKRLMEVKASARQHKEQNAAHGADGKGLVDKIKNEAKVNNDTRFIIPHVLYILVVGFKKRFAEV